MNHPYFAGKTSRGEFFKREVRFVTSLCNLSCNISVKQPFKTCFLTISRRRRGQCRLVITKPEATNCFSINF